jgi:hypothetical protein
MSEEQQEGTMSSLKKTVVGTLATVVTAGGAWLGSTLFGGGSDDKDTPAPAPVINITNSNQQAQQASGGTTIIKERVVEKPAAQPAAKPEKNKKKEGDEFKEEAPKW